VSKTIIPPYLKPGDTVGILCTARFISKEELAPSIKLLEGWGLKVKIGNTVGKQVDQMGGTDSEKVIDLQAMIEDDSISCIWCARGGYGTVRIVDQINFDSLLKHPKWILGFSDITVLHSQLLKLNIASLHGPLCSTIEKSSGVSIEHLKAALWGEELTYECDAHELNVAGNASGILCGGNLSLLYSMIGSPSDIDTSGKILFLEDLDEYLYHIDRMMMALKRAGKLANLAGLVVGGMTEMNDNEVPFGKSAEAIIAEHTASFNYPICFNFPCGHQAENATLKMGISAQLIVNQSGSTLSFN